MDSDPIISKGTQFLSYLIPLVPSILCSLFVLYHYLFDRTQRNALNNHVFLVIIIIGLIYQTVLLPCILFQYRLDYIWVRSPGFCALWSFMQIGLFNTQTIFFAWASLERHILIFNDRLMRQKRGRILFHY